MATAKWVEIKDTPILAIVPPCSVPSRFFERKRIQISCVRRKETGCPQPRWNPDTLGTESGAIPYVLSG